MADCLLVLHPLYIPSFLGNFAHSVPSVLSFLPFLYFISVNITSSSKLVKFSCSWPCPSQSSFALFHLFALFDNICLPTLHHSRMFLLVKISINAVFVERVNEWTNLKNSYSKSLWQLLKRKLGLKVNFHNFKLM